MGVAQGYGKIVTSGLVFAYDARDYRNSYKGAPGTNIAAGPNRNYNGASLSTYSNGKLFSSNGYTETVYIPTLGYRTVESVEIYNVYSSYGADGNYNCCPSLFNYAGGQEFTGGTTYTYQIIYRCESGYTNPNYMYHYEYGPSGYITEYGVHTEAQREHLGDGWYHAWATFTTNAATTSGHKGMWYYQYNVRDKVSVAAVSIVPGTIIRPPLQFIDENTTRSSTDSLYDLTGNSGITLNASYDSNGDLVFDGTDDHVLINRDVLSANSPYTLFTILRPTNISSPNDSFPWYNSYPNGFWHHVSANGIAWRHQGQSGTLGGLNIQNNVYTSLSVSWDGSTLTLYQNGVLVNSVSVTAGHGINSSSNKIGMLSNRGAANDYNYNGKAPVNLVYNRALSAAEILQLHNHYKSRYNI